MLRDFRSAFLLNRSHKNVTPYSKINLVECINPSLKKGDNLLAAALPYQFSLGILRIQECIPCENRSGFASQRILSPFLRLELIIKKYLLI